MAIKNIKFRLKLSGYGVVNYDEYNNQKMNVYKDQGRFFQNDVKVAKRVMVSEDESQVIIDSNKLRREIFGERISPYDLVSDDIIIYNIVKNSMVVGGYTNVVNKGDKNYGLQRKSSLSISNARLENNIKPSMVLRSSQDIDPTTGERAKTSLLNVETLGDNLIWTCEGNLSVSELQFFSCDKKKDRQGAREDWATSGKLVDALRRNYKEYANPSIGYFCSVKDRFDLEEEYRRYETPELGILFNDELIAYLLKTSLKKLMGIYYDRADGHIETTSLEILFVKDILDLDDNKSWISLRNEKDIDDLDLSDLYHKYTKVDETSAQKFYEAKEEYAKVLKKTKEEKKQKKSGKASKKTDDEVVLKEAEGGA